MKQPGKTGKLITKGSLTRAVLFLVLQLLLFLPPWTQAQGQGVSWSFPRQLSNEGAVPSEAFMLADQHGYVHVFWIESKHPDDNRPAIQYTRFDGETWSDPIDIYATNPNIPPNYVSLSLDQNDTLHLVWTEGNSGPAYHMSAPAYNTLSARHWTTPRLIDISAYWAKLHIDSEGVFHLLYSDFWGLEPGTYYVRSKDQGLTWSESYWLDPDIPYGEAPQVIQFEADDSDGLHAMWYYLDLESDLGTLIRYAHSLDGGETWSLPITIDEADELDEEATNSTELRLASPNMIVQSQTVHIVWAGDRATHREHRFSTDAGLTWSDTSRAFGDLIGQAIGDGLAVDGAGRVHFAGQIRNPQGVWHAYWDGSRWAALSRVYNINDREKDIHAHRVRLAIRAGNQPVVTFTDGAGGGALYVMHGILNDVSQLPAVPTPVPTATPVPSQPSPTPIPLEPTPRPTRPEFEASATLPLANAPTPGLGLWIGLVPALLLVGGVMVVQIIRRR